MRSFTRALLVVALTLALGGGALADSHDLRSTSLFSPDSPLFGLQRVLDWWEEFIASDPLEKAQVHAKIASNRHAEVSAMIKAKRTDLAARLAAEMAERVEKAAARLAEAKAKAEQESDKAAAQDREARIAEVLGRLQENADRQQQTLQDVIDKVENERAKEALMQAKERSAFGLQNAMERISGERGPAQPPATQDTTTTTTGTQPGSAPAAPVRPSVPPSPRRP